VTLNLQLRSAQAEPLLGMVPWCVFGW